MQTSCTSTRRSPRSSKAAPRLSRALPTTLTAIRATPARRISARMNLPESCWILPRHHFLHASRQHIQDTEPDSYATITDATGVPTSGVGLPSFTGGSTPALTQAPRRPLSVAASTNSPSAPGRHDNDLFPTTSWPRTRPPTPNVRSNPSAGASGFTSNPPAASTPPTTPNSYTIFVCHSGTKTVGMAEITPA